MLTWVVRQFDPRRRGVMRFLSGLMVGVFLLTNAGISYGFVSDKKPGAIVASAYVDIDTDGDGLGDRWEEENFGSIAVYNGQDDPDNDGYDNLWEYQHGTDPNDAGDPNYFLPASNNALKFLMAMMDKTITSGRRVLHSYQDAAGVTGGLGWTYDNAISIMAFEGRGEWERARDVLDAFIWLQDMDPEKDGRIRKAYWASAPIPLNSAGIDDCGDWIPDPAVNADASDQSVGDMAIMVLAALRYYEHINGTDGRYLNFAKRLGDWIWDNAKSTDGIPGYHMARKDKELADPSNFDRKSTENNIDAYVAFMKLYEMLNDHNYRVYALQAKNFVLTMWNEDREMFWTGTLDDGETVNGGSDSDVTGHDYDTSDPTSGQPEDVNTWALTALGEISKYGTGIDWIETECRVDNKDGFTFGYDFNSDRDGIWFEGMSHIALCYKMLGKDDRSKDILDIVIEAQHTVKGGIKCASHKGVTTSFYWELTDELHVAPAAWFIFAVDGYNPFWGQPITEAIPYEGGYDTSGKYIFEEPWAQAYVTDIAPATDGTARAMADLDGLAGDDKGTLTTSDDGDIVKYEWDFDGKGTYDWSSTSTASVRYWYTDVGSHQARLRVTNDMGYSSTREVAINILPSHLGAGFSPPAVSQVTPSTVSGNAPLAVTFTGTASDPDGYIAAYEWDFDGNGEYDSYSQASGNVTYTYSEKGRYAPTFRVTDNDGLTDTAVLVIEVLENANGPQAKAGIDKTAGIEPCMVSFNAAGSSGNIITYEWDFDGDAIYDWSSSESGSAAFTYREPGTYEAGLRVTDVNGVSGTDSVKIRVRHNDSAFTPEAIGDVASPADIIPFDAAFSHSSSIGSINNFEWDFQGDKKFDKSSASPDDAIYTYTRPGYYLAVLRVTDDSGLSHRTYVPVVATGPDQAGALYSSYIKTPKHEQRIYGDSVTVTVGIMPNSDNQQIGLEYKPTTAGDNAWSNLRTAVSYPYRTTINASALAAGNYDLRAPVNNIADKAKSNVVIIDPVDWDIHETIDANGERVKQVKIKTNASGVNDYTEVELVDGTRCVLPSGALDGENTLIIRTPNGSGRLINNGENSILYHREFKLAGDSPLNKPITIIIPYDDANDDGIVDGLGIREQELKLYMYNEDNAEWEALANYQIYTGENYVSGETSHLSIFGIGNLDSGGGGIAQAGHGGGGSGSGGGGRSCFIATATFGTPMAQEVQSLRFFRDTYLLTSPAGEFVIDIYERYSPPVARVIAGSGLLKGMIRYYLRPIIGFSRLANVITAKMPKFEHVAKKYAYEAKNKGADYND